MARQFGVALTSIFLLFIPTAYAVKLNKIPGIHRLKNRGSVEVYALTRSTVIIAEPVEITNSTMITGEFKLEDTGILPTIMFAGNGYLQIADNKILTFDGVCMYLCKNWLLNAKRQPIPIPLFTFDFTSKASETNLVRYLSHHLQIEWFRCMVNPQTNLDSEIKVIFSAILPTLK